MTDPTTPPMNNDNTNGTNDSPIPQGDDLDLLLREWHDAHGSRAGELKDELMARVRQRTPGVAGRIEHPAGARRSRRHSWTTGAGVLAAAALVMLLTVGLVFKRGLAPIGPGNGTGIHANFLRVCDVPAGGRLEALDARGMVIGVCPLQHTDVTVDVTGFVARVTLEQRYANPYDDKIEGVYTFPMSQDGAVDRMEMIVGDRVVVGEVKERELARKVYEAAKNANRVAALLEQERPNIFTQSVANIEPGHEVTVRISYVEMLERSDGVFSFDFPMVVAPRYIPGSTSLAPQDHDPQGLIFGCEHRRGLVMLAPGAIELAQPGNIEHLGEVSQDRLLELIERAKPVTPPTIIDGPASARTDPWYRFMIRYADGAVEAGVIDSNGLGQLAGRWFQADLTTLRPVSAPIRPGAGAEPGAPFEANTDQVPDASRITPMPVPPGQRAGHDISITVNIDTGGPGITSIDSRLHKVQRTDGDLRADGLPTQTTITLAGGKTIPNKDFILAWEQSADTVEHASFVHSGDLGGFMSVIVEPPARINDAHAAPRELIFVLDTSGSMSGFPIEKAKAVMIRAMSELRPQDTFNVITFAGSTQILWDKPRPGSEANVAEAQGFINGKSGGGGTEMMTAINAALKQGNPEQPVLSADELLALPCDGRPVVVSLRSLHESGRQVNFIASPGAEAQPFADWLKAYLMTARIGPMFWNNTLKGRWAISAGEPTLIFDGWGEAHTAPIRIVCFMTDGHVGNDMAIIDAVKNNRQTTRVFSFGIGNAPNRYLLTSMAKAGLGEAEFVTLDDNADAKAMRFAERIRTPVLTHVELEFGPGLAMEDAVSPNAIAPLERLDEQNVIRLGIPDGAVYRVPDLFDQRPVIVHARFQKTRPNLNETTITLRGRNAQGPFERTFTIDLPDAGEAPDHDVVPTLWARQKVEALMNQDLKAAQSGAVDADTKGQIVALGERFSIVTQFTSFVAVDMARVTIDGQPRLVHIPIEMPDGMSWQGVFGGEMPHIRRHVASADEAGKADAFYMGAAVETAAAAQFGREATHQAMLGLMTYQSSISPEILKNRAPRYAGEAGDGSEKAPEQSADDRYAWKSGVAEMRTFSGDAVLQQPAQGGGGGGWGLFSRQLDGDNDTDADDVNIMLGDFGSVATDLNLYPSDVVGGSTAGYVGFIQDPADPANFTFATDTGTPFVIPAPHPLSVIPLQQAGLDLINGDGSSFEGIFEAEEAGRARGRVSGFTILGSLDASDNPAVQGATITTQGVPSQSATLGLAFQPSDSFVGVVGKALALDSGVSAGQSPPTLGDIPALGGVFKPQEGAKTYALDNSDPTTVAEHLGRLRGTQTTTALPSSGPAPPPAKAAPPQPSPPNVPPDATRGVAREAGAAAVDLDVRRVELAEERFKLRDAVQAGLVPEAEAAQAEDRITRELEEVSRIDELQQRAEANAASLTMQKRPEEAALRRAKRDRIAENMTRLHQLQLEHKYAEAGQVVDEILTLEPDNASARLMGDILHDIQVYEAWEKQHKPKFKSWSREMLDIDQATIIPDSVMDYPEDWPEITMKRGAVVDTHERVAQVHQSLEAIQIPGSFSAPLEQALDLVATIVESQVNEVRIDWEALEAAGVSRVTPIALDLGGISAREALDAIIAVAQGAGEPRIAWGVGPGVVHVTTPAEVARKRFIVIYDVSDVKPDMLVGLDPTADPASAIDERVGAIVRSMVTPGSWDTKGAPNEDAVGILRTLNGNLVVTHTIAGHTQIASLLRHIREGERRAVPALHDASDLIGATILENGSPRTLATAHDIAAKITDAAAQVDAWDPALKGVGGFVAGLDTVQGHQATMVALNMLRLARLKGEGAAGSDGDDGPLGARVLDACEIAIRASQPDKARAWCDSLRRLNVAEAPLAARVYAALTDESLEPDARSAAAVALIDALQARVAEVARHVKIAHTLPAELRGESADEPGDGPIRVSVLASSLDEPALSAMRAAGLTVDGVSNTAGLVVGSIDRASLESLAALDVVRWIEPTRAREVGLAPAAR